MEIIFAGLILIFFVPLHYSINGNSMIIRIKICLSHIELQADPRRL